MSYRVIVEEVQDDGASEPPPRKVFEQTFEADGFDLKKIVSVLNATPRGRKRKAEKVAAK